jgi:hypothetical protein
VFGARAQSESGTQPVTATFRRVAGWFSDVQHYNWETIASACQRRHGVHGVIKTLDQKSAARRSMPASANRGLQLAVP